MTIKEVHGIKFKKIFNSLTWVDDRGRVNAYCTGCSGIRSELCGKLQDCDGGYIWIPEGQIDWQI